MPSLRDIRGKIKSIKNIQQITKAMKMVAASRFRRAQARIVAARPFAQRMEEIIQDLLQGETEFEHLLVNPRPGPRRILIVVTSDKGLCGAFNTNIIREAVRYLRRYGAENVKLLVVGRKGRDYFSRIGVVPVKEYVHFFQKLSFAQAEIVAKDVLDIYSAEPVSSVEVLYNEFKSIMQQVPKVKVLLPMKANAPPEPADTEHKIPDYIFEPSKKELLSGLMLRSLKAQIFRALLESNASELGARMAAMENASSNAKELIGSLTLQLNRTRQASITKEILEVVGGAEALR